MNQPDLFNGEAPAAASQAAQGAAAEPCPCDTLAQAKSSACCADCSADALQKVDVRTLRRLCLEEFERRPAGATADEIYAAVRWKVPTHVDELSIRPRVAQLKAAGIVVATGERRRNRRGNTCAVLKHYLFMGYAKPRPEGKPCTTPNA